MRPGVVVLYCEVLEAEVEEVLHVGIDHKAGQRARFAGKLEARLVEVVEVEVGIARRMHELARLEATHLRHHREQEGVAGDVERHTQERVGRSLVELEREASVGHVELEEQVAGRQVHLAEVGHIPGRHYQTARIGILLNLVHHLANLVYVSALIVGPRPPLVAVDMAEVALFVGPFVPDADSMVVEILHVGVAAEKPQQFVDDALEVKLLGGHERESLAEVEAHLMAEHALCPRARAVILHHALIKDAAQEVLVLFHVCCFRYLLECHKITEKLLPDQILNLNTNRFKGFRHKQPSIGNWEFGVVSGTHDLSTLPPLGCFLW